jgi:hypothetical protein
VAISANTVFEVQTGGSDSNGGGFVTGATGTDRSLGTSAHATLTTASVVHSTTTQINVDAGDYTVTNPGDVGNIIQVSVNGGALAYYQITVSDTANNRWTVDRAVGTAGQTVAGSMGGCLATPGAAAAAATVNGNLIWVKAGTYTLSTATPGKGGPVLLGSSINVKMEGYSATRGDRAGRPVLDAGAQTTLTLYSGQINGVQNFVHLQADGNSGSGVSGFLLSNPRWSAIDCVAVDCDQASQAGFTSVAGPLNVIACKAQNCTTGFATGGFLKCWADACGLGFNVTTVVCGCIASDCTGDGYNLGLNGTNAVRCVADGNGGDGFDLTSTTAECIECVSSFNTGMGFNGNTTGLLWRCASITNTGGRTDFASRYDVEPILLTVDPYTNAGADDYSINNTAGGGADLRALGIDPPGQTDHTDIGALQHADPAAGGAKPYGLQPIPYGV